MTMTMGTATVTSRVAGRTVSQGEVETSMMNSERYSASARWFDAVSATADEAELRRMIQTLQVDVDICDESGWTALHRAAWNGQTDTARHLLDSGANPNFPGPKPTTRASPVLRHIDNRGVQIVFDGCHEVTPLHLAVQNGHTAVVKLLVERGADTSAAMSMTGGVAGVTSLHLAVQHDHLDIIDVLLGARSDVNAKTTTTIASDC